MLAWTDRPRARWATYVVVAALGLAQLWLYCGGLPAEGGTTAFAWRAMVLVGLQAASVVLLWRRNEKAVLWGIVVFAIAFRVAAWTWPPDLSSDLHRYAWDGRVQLSGRSPYAAPPADPSLSDLRDSEIWPRINRPEAITVYPPGGQVVFLGLAAAGLDSVAGIKAAASLAEVFTLLLLVLVLSRRELPVGRLALYAWSPLIISEVCVSGHLDAFVLPLITLALLCAEQKRPTLAGALIGAAAAMKLYPILLLAALPRRVAWRAAAASLAVIGVGYAIYAPPVGLRVLGFLPDYVRTGEDFNLGLRGFVQSALAGWLPQARPVAMAVCAALLIASLVWVWQKREDDAFVKAGVIALAYLVFLPTAAHPWYALWLVPFLVVRPLPAGLWIVATLPLSYLKYGTPGDEMPPWVPVLIWVPALVLIGVHGMVRWRGRASAASEA